jgi:ParB-like chromosome segregation protein Spo0J
MTQELETVPEGPPHMAPGDARDGSGTPPTDDTTPADLPRKELSRALLGDHTQRRLESIHPDRIEIGHRARALNPERVEALMESIRNIGLRSPITVRIVPKMVIGGIGKEEVPVLVAGLHRLEALKRLGVEPIDCFVESGSELDAQLWEIDENLCRAELTELERAEHLQKRKTVYEQMCPEARQGGLPGAPGGGKAKTANLASFAADTAAKTGISERTIRRDARRASKIDPAVRDRIRDKRAIADSGAELDTLASMPASNQSQVIDMVEEGRAASVREARKRLAEPEQAGRPEAKRPEAGKTETEPVGLESPRREEAVLQQASLQGGHNHCPNIDPFEEGDPPWINGALKLIPRLAEALPTDAIPNRNAIIRGALELIPPLAEAVLELPYIPEQRLIEGLLKYCGYRDYANRMSRPETTLCAGREDGFEAGCNVANRCDVAAATLPDAMTTAATTSSVTDLEVTEAANVT